MSTMHFSINYLLTTFVVILLATFPFVGGTEILQTIPIVNALGIALLAMLFLFQKRFNFIATSTWLLLLAIIITPLLYLIPISAGLWDSLPGREIYSQIMQWVQSDPDSIEAYRSFSLIPYRTEHAFYALLPAVAIFLTVASLPNEQKKFIVYIMLGIAAAQASLAAIQFGSGNDYFYFGIPRLKQGIAYGTYPNPDHFVLLMEIAIPLTIALLTYELRFGKNRKGDGSQAMMLIIIYSIMAVLFIAAAFFSGSRAGIPLALLGAYLAYTILMRSTNNKRIAFFAAILIILTIILLSFINLTPIINRFIANDPFIDGRWKIFAHSWDGIVAFFPLGSGPGTYPDIYRIFQPIDQTGFINHAHNDYLEVLFETGLIGLVLMNIFIYKMIKVWRNIRHKRTSEMHYIRIATGISLFVTLLHSLLEFNMHDSTNILFFGALAGIYFNSEQKTKRVTGKTIST